VLFRSYNTLVEKFPSNLIARAFGRAALPQFTTAPETREAPRIDFGEKK
jgi:hypothetical protein